MGARDSLVGAWAVTSGEGLFGLGISSSTSSATSHSLGYATNYIPCSTSFFPKKPPQFNNRRRNPVVKFTCKAKNGETSPGKFDRRDVLLGLGGLYSTSLAANPMALAYPALPDFKHCVDATQPDNIDKTGIGINCCPPPVDRSRIKDFVPCVTTVNTRKPAYLFDVSSDYYKKYTSAIQKMKNLSPSDPRNFRQQANIHCANCDGGYYLVGSPELYDVHYSWLFFPWHRWYLYFFEKICQNLIDDDTFTLPFWNWDAPEGMQIPSIYNSGLTSPLYDCFRNSEHLPPTVIDLEWFYGKKPEDPKIQIENNLSTMYRQMITQSKTPTDFFGKAYRAGDDPPTIGDAGQIELTPHNDVHVWTGISEPPNAIDLGALYSSARDPMFYAHHSNVDRLWTIWVNKLGGSNFTDPDWLFTKFIFYNEEAKPVRVSIKDGLDITKLGYKYEDVPIPWLDDSAKPKPRAKAKTLPSAPDPAQVFPTTLDKPINVIVKRPKKSGIGSSEEILVIEGIEYDKRNYVKFIIYINEDDVNTCRPNNTEFLGSFSNLPHGHQMTAKARKKFRISQVLEELGADRDKVLVTLIPKSNYPVKINGIKIEFEDS
ncbi:Polyphenol oxidase A1 [Forsythia ovata]|uniref:Polyphenol oxidase A1 n=1 Tax=Forsythia ovata TaxID=205694 RepID=A0ABD1WHI7_9LAMI